MRLRVDFAYDGTDFSGWAAQPGRRTVEHELSTALTTVLRAPEPVRLVVAGRTDAGVHAHGAVCHADVDPGAFAALPGRSDRPPEVAAVTRLNGVLPADVVVRQVCRVSEDFDARFSALRRRYAYRVCDRPELADPVRRREVVVVRRPLDVEAMNAACERLVGLHDFAAFCKQREGATTVRTLLEYRWQRVEAGLVEARVVADAFCHSMVRALVGAAVAVGQGQRDPQWAVEVLQRRRRDPAVAVMPAHGLSLKEVVYPGHDELAARAREARAVRSLPGADGGASAAQA